jgi:ABC-type branched-subunit amino acid transport system substrate-binding protein
MSPRLRHRIIALAVLAPVLASCARAEGGETSTAIKLMTITSVNAELQNYPDVKAGAEAAAKAINDDGGIDGRKIDLIFCNSQSDPNQALACARKAVSEKVAAVVGHTDTFSTQTLPVLEAADIPAIGLEPRGNPIELQSATSYPFDGGSPGDSVAAPYGLKAAGAKRVVAVSADVPSAVANIDLVRQGAEAAGIEFAGSVKIPTSGVTDYAPFAQQIRAMNGDSAMFNATVAQIQGLMKATKSLGMKVTYAQHATAFGTKEAKATGSVVDGMLLVSAFPAYSDTDNPAIAQFNEEMDAAGSTDPGLKRSTAINAWLSVYAVKNLITGEGGTEAITGDVTNAKLNDALGKVKDMDLMGLATWSPSQTGPEQFPRVAHAKYEFLVVKGGDVEPTGYPSVDIIEVLSQS